MVADHIHNHRHSQNASDCENVQASSGIPANGTVLVISPLVALIEKQVNKLVKMGIRSVNLCAEIRHGQVPLPRQFDTDDLVSLSSLKSRNYR